MSSGANDAVIFLQVAMIFQYMAMYWKLAGVINYQMRIGFMFQSGSAKFPNNLLKFFLFSHVVGWLNLVLLCITEG